MKLSDAAAADFTGLLDSIQAVPRPDTVEGAARSFVDLVYEQFRESLLLLRLFMSLPYSSLQAEDRALVDTKGKDSGNAHLIAPHTQVLTLLGTRGREPEWNARSTSVSFRCIPLFSSGYVSSLSMLAMQFRKMNFDLSLLDAPGGRAFAATGRADQYRGTLFVEDAGVDKDELGRMVVPRQDFVSRYGVKTALGFGSGYADYPAMVTLFAFAGERLPEQELAPFETLLEAYMAISRGPVKKGHFFS